MNKEQNAVNRQILHVYATYSLECAIFREKSKKYKKAFKEKEKGRLRAKQTCEQKSFCAISGRKSEKSS